MTDLAPNHEPHWPPVGTGLWTRWWGYLVRWLVFGLVVHLFQPVKICAVVGPQRIKEPNAQLRDVDRRPLPYAFELLRLQKAVVGKPDMDNCGRLI